MAIKFGVIGFGNMGGAIVKGAVNQGVIAKEDINVFDIREEKNQEARDFGLNVLASDEEVALQSDVILLAVKPQQMLDATAMTKKGLEGKAMFSIVAGVSVERLRAAIDANVRIMRLLPNTPALVFEGAFAMCKDNDLTEAEKEFAAKLFSSIGVVEWITEKDIDAACGLSGGGPAWVAMFIEAMSDGGVKMGLTRDVAYKLAAQTVLGTAKMYLETGMHPGQIKDMVTSPAGTTIEGCEVLEQNNFRYAVMKCVVEATKRSQEL